MPIIYILFTSFISLHLEFFEGELALLVKHIVLSTKEEIYTVERKIGLKRQRTYRTFYTFNVVQICNRKMTTTRHFVTTRPQQYTFLFCILYAVLFCNDSVKSYKIDIYYANAASMKFISWSIATSLFHILNAQRGCFSLIRYWQLYNLIATYHSVNRFTIYLLLSRRYKRNRYKIFR